MSDTGTRIVAEELENNTKLATLISEATGMVKASLFRAQRYTQANLDDDLTGSSLAFLTGVVCQVAWWYLWRRKPAASNQDPQRKEAREHYEAILKELNAGTLVLDIETVKEAGVQEGKIVSAMELASWNLWSTAACGRHYPARRFPNP